MGRTKRLLRFLVWLSIGGVAFGSCTCNRGLPPPPERSERRGGFAAALPTPRQTTGQVLVARATAIVPTLPPTGETPTPGATGLPEDFPADVPIFRDAEAFAVQNLAGKARNVLFRASAEPTEIFAYYRETMRNEGWNVTQEYQGKDQSFLSFRKGKMITNVTVAKDPRTGKQVIAVMYYEEEELPFPEF